MTHLWGCCSAEEPAGERGDFGTHLGVAGALGDSSGGVGIRASSPSSQSPARLLPSFCGPGGPTMLGPCNRQSTFTRPPAQSAPRR